MAESDVREPSTDAVDITAPALTDVTALLDPLWFNAYRILGLPVSATKKELRESYHQHLARSRAGGYDDEGGNDPAHWRLDRTESSLRKAYASLESPSERIVQRLFWYEKESWMDEEVMEQLSTTPSIPIKTLASRNSGGGPPGPSPSSTNRLINAYILTLAADGTRDDSTVWKNIMTYMKSLAESNTYWTQQMTFETGGDFEPGAELDDFKELKTKFLRKMLSPLFEYLHRSMMAERYDRVARILRCVRESALPREIRENFEFSLVDPFRIELETRLDTLFKTMNDGLAAAGNDAYKNKTACRRALESYNADIAPMVNKIEMFLAPDSELLKEVRETTAYSVRTLAIALHNKAGEVEASKQLIEQARAMVLPYSGSSIAAAKLEEDIKYVSESVKKDKVWGNLKPIKSAPSLTTINTIGFKLYGGTDYDPETNSHLATLYFVILFIPLFPIARYRVEDTLNGGYKFYGQAPLRQCDVIHLIIGLGIFLLIAIGVMFGK